MLAMVLATACLAADSASGAATGQNIESSIPRLVSFSGVVKGHTGPAVVTFSWYDERESSSPVWFENQNVELDAQGRYTVLLGATRTGGLPEDLFTIRKARWLGVQAQLPGEGEQPRIMLLGVPYAMKAGDADTLGGKPASAYVTVETAGGTAPSTAGSHGVVTAGATGGATLKGERLQVQAAAGCPAVSSSGSAPANTVAKFPTPCDLEASAITETGGNVGIGTSAPAYALDVNGTIQSAGDLRLGSNATIYRAGSPFIYAFVPPGSYGVNTFAGRLAGNTTMAATPGSNWQASYNSIFGDSAFSSNTTGYDDTALGYLSLNANTAGYEDTAIGAMTMQSNQTGRKNVAIGFQAMQNVTSGQYNSAAGFQALWQLSTAEGNAGYGDEALYHTTTGQFNTCMGGEQCMWSNTTGSYNNGLGTQAMFFNTVGSFNTGIGNSALYSNDSGLGNVAVGSWAGAAGSPNGQVSGPNANINGNYNVWLGYQAGPSTSSLTNSIGIGYQVQNTQSNQVIIGNPSVTQTLLRGNVGINNPAPADGLDINTTAANILVGQANGTTQIRVDNTGKGYFNGGTTTGGADFAESVAIRGDRAEYEPGDVLVVDRHGRRHLARSDRPYSTLVAGIYSTKPGVLATPHKTDDPRINRDEVPLAIVGIVPCKVTAANGAVRAGDLLVTSAVPGRAMKGVDRSRMQGAVIGKALEPLSQGTGIIEVLVSLQ